MLLSGFNLLSMIVNVVKMNNMNYGRLSHQVLYSSSGIYKVCVKTLTAIFCAVVH